MVKNPENRGIFCGEQLSLLGLPELTTNCHRCGTGFAIAFKRSTGRPIVFCSEECRRAEASEQRREWASRDHGAEKGRCKICGAAFDVVSKRAGRWPGFCSDDCRRQAHRQRLAKSRSRGRGRK